MERCCKQCGIDISPRQNNAQFCSVKCRNKYWRLKYKSERDAMCEPKLCSYCNSNIVAKHRNAIYCSSECTTKAKKIREKNYKQQDVCVNERTCRNCNCIILGRRSNARFCSTKCKKQSDDINYRETHKKEAKLYQQQYRIENKVKSNAYGRDYYQSHKQERNVYNKYRYDNDPQFRIATILRNRIRAIVGCKRKPGSAVGDLGCTIEQLLAHLESMFYINTMTGEMMSWSNMDQWDIDHIIPLASFDLTNRDQFLMACNFLNLQPLWKEDHFKKTSEDVKALHAKGK